MKELFNPQLYRNSKISNITLSPLSDTLIKKLSVLRVTTRDLYDEQRNVIPEGVLDTRLGLGSKLGTCGHCGRDSVECIGHTGHYELFVPLIHPGYLKKVVDLLRRICIKCAKLLVNKKKENGCVCRDRFKIIKNNGRLYALGSDKLSLDLSPIAVKNIFERIPKSSYKNLGLDCNPADFIVQTILVPPCCIRPSVAMDADCVNENEMTIKLSEIIHTDKQLRMLKTLSFFMEDYDFLQNVFNTYCSDILTRLKGKVGRFRGNLMGKRCDFTARTVITPDPYLSVDQVGIPKELASILTISEKVTSFNLARLKVAVLRGEKYPGANYLILNNENQYFNQDGKEIAGTPTGQISIPNGNKNYSTIDNLSGPIDKQAMSRNENKVEMLKNNDSKKKTLEYNIPVTSNSYPSTKIFLRYGDRCKLSNQLKVGDVVERHLMDGDIVLFNRQPSLHKLSVMAHRVKVHKDRTFKLNECVCTPYGADFDGDEMNVHAMQTITSRAEAIDLMALGNNMLSPRSGQPMIACIQDFITGAYMLTGKDCLLTKTEFITLIVIKGGRNKYTSGEKPEENMLTDYKSGKKLEMVEINENIIKPEIKIPETEGDKKAKRGRKKKEVEKILKSDLNVLNNEKRHESALKYREHTENANRGNLVDELSFTDGAFLHGKEKKGDVFKKSGKVSHTVTCSLIGEIYPTVFRPVILYTGKQVVNCILNGLNTSITFKNKTKSFKRTWHPNDSKIVIRNNFLVCGRFDKSTIGTENRDTSLIYHLNKISNKTTMQFINRICVVCAHYLTNYGFSIGFDDLNPNNELILKKNDILSSLRLDDESEEKQCSVLNGAREECGKLFVEDLSLNNAPRIMATCGSKGSVINISQMIALVGQQIIGGCRIPDGFTERTLPHFVRLQKKEESGTKKENMQGNELKTFEEITDATKDSTMAKGFVRSSFRSGMNSFEFFFHAVSGREGLIDTAVKTAETGYMQRRLMKALEDIIVCYDYSVWAKKMIVQFVYGDDGCDPTIVEGFEWTCNAIYNDMTSGGSKNEIYENEEQMLCKTECNDYVNNEIVEEKNSKKRKNSEVIIELNLQNEVFNHESKKYKQFLYNKNTDTKIKKWLSSKNVSESFTKQFLNKFYERKKNQLIEPGTAVGALCGQSIGEPGTQMTLKTFHFAGVASMNITLGVPRLKEIINAVRNISTPIIKAFLLSDSLISAKKTMGSIDKIYFKDILLSVTEIYSNNELVIEAEICFDTINKLFLNITMDSIYAKIKAVFKNDIKSGFINKNVLILVINSSDEKSYNRLKSCKRNLLNIIVSNISTIDRVVITKDKEYYLLIEGFGLRNILGIPGVDARRTTTNNIMEIYSCLGVEATRQSIINELKYTMDSHGIYVDMRHLMLLADTMTVTGEVLGITRFGIKKFKTNSLMLASFEETGEHLYKAAMRRKKEKIDGVSECVLVGKNIKIGTGMIELYLE